MKVETTLPLQKEARILRFTKDESLASFQWCLLQIVHNYPLSKTNKIQCLPDKTISLTTYLISIGSDRHIPFSIRKISYKGNKHKTLFSLTLTLGRLRKYLRHKPTTLFFPPNCSYALTHALTFVWSQFSLSQSILCSIYIEFALSFWRQCGINSAATTVNWYSIFLLPGHQPKLPDSVKLLLRDATYLGFHTDCLFKSIDWRFLY